MTIIKGKRVKLDGSLKNKDIKKGKWYLAHTDFGWQLGHFERKWYGWSLDVPMSEIAGHQLDDIDDLYEIELPKVRRQRTQTSIEMERRKKTGACLQCGAKGTPGYPHSRFCKDNPHREEEEEEERY